MVQILDLQLQGHFLKQPKYKCSGKHYDDLKMKKAVNQVEEMRVVLPKSSNRHDGVVIGKNMGITHIMLCPIIAKILLLMPKKLTKTLNNLGLKNEFFYKKTV